MESDSRRKLTGAECRRLLSDHFKNDLRGDAILLAVFTLLFLPAIVFFLYLLPRYLLPCLILLPVFSCSPVIFLVQLIRDWRRLKKAERNEFSVAVDTVSRVAPGETIYRRHAFFRVSPGRFHFRAAPPEDAIYFSEHGRFVPSRTVFQMTSEGDTFYLLILSGETSPTLIFSDRQATLPKTAEPGVDGPRFCGSALP